MTTPAGCVKLASTDQPHNLGEQMKTMICTTLALMTFSANVFSGSGFPGIPLVNTLECISMDNTSDLQKAVFQTNGFTEQVLFTFNSRPANPFASRINMRSNRGILLVPAREGFRWDSIANFGLPLKGGLGTVTVKQRGVDLENSKLKTVQVECLPL